MAAESAVPEPDDDFLNEASFAALAEDEPTFELSVVARAPTLDDPLTTTLLAEVARSETMVEEEDDNSIVLEMPAPVQRTAMRGR